jgi:hypothetical protein
MWWLGTFLNTTPRLKQGRPPKNVHGGRLPSLRELGIKDRHIASRAMAVAKIPEEVFRRYLETENEPTERGLLRYANGECRPSVDALRKELGERDKRIEELEARNRELSKEVGAARQRRRRAQAVFWLTPPHLLRQVTDEFGPFFDACPYPRPENFNSLEIPWGKVTYCNPPFLRTDEGLLAWVEKSIREAKLGKTILLPLPTRSIINVLLESGVNLEMRSWERVGWLSTTTGKPHPSPPPVTLFILRGSRETVPAAASIGIWYQHPEEIAERLVAADRKNAGEVWWALSDRLASSMSIFFLSGHGIENPR